MRLKKILFIISVSIFQSQSLAVGATTQIDSIYSEALGEMRRVEIFTPPGYNAADSSTRYPVVYFLHGGSVGVEPYVQGLELLSSITTILNFAIIVLPDGLVGPFEGSFFTNSELYGNFEDYIVEDVINHVDANFHTLATREKRAIAGHSMGAYGAMKIALKHSDLFSVVAAHSGPQDFNQLPILIPNILTESGGAAPYNYTPASGFSRFGFTMAGAFSPNLAKQPYQVDFFLDRSGNIINDVFQRWQQENPARLASTIYIPENEMAIYFDCGLQDDFKLHGFNVAFSDTLTRLGITHRFESFDGGHTDQLIFRTPISFAFIDSVFQSNPVSVAVNETFPVKITLLQNYPNPFNPATSIEFSLPKSEYAELVIFNLLGQKVATLFEGNLNAGRHKFKWFAQSQPGGIYFYQLKTESFVSTRRLTLVK